MSESRAPLIPVPIVATSERWIPEYQSFGASGADLLAAIDETVCIEPGKAARIPTGLRMQVPEGFEVQVRSRSGLALHSQVVVLNSPGTVDSDYRGEICVILMNHGETAYLVLPGMRIAQMVLVPVARAVFVPVQTLEQTTRGAGGFGHTGA